MRSNLILFYILFISIGFNVKAQNSIIDKAIAQLSTIKNISYTENRTTKDFFSDDLRKELFNVKLSSQVMENKNIELFDFTTSEKKVIFNGSSLLRLNTKKKDYVIDKKPQVSLYLDESIFGWLERLRDFNVNKPNKIKSLADTIVNNIQCYHFKIIASDSLIKNERQYTLYEVYLNKINNLPVRTKKSMRGILSKGGYEVAGMITYRHEQTFSNYKINDKAFPNLDEFKIPADYNPEKNDADKPLLAVGTEAPEWSLVNTAGKSLSSKELKGKVILIDFTSTTCVACILAAPTMNSLHQKYENTNVEVVSINSWENKEAVIKFVKQHKINYPIYLDPKKLEDKYNVSSIPTFYIIDKNGKIAASYSGYSDKLAGDVISKIAELSK